MTTHFGNQDANEGYPLAVWLWGHRLREGQHWMEYLLEFLNVFAGFDFQLGQGVDGAERQTYRRLTRLGLRRFVFYDDKEKTRHPMDDRARQLLFEALRQNKAVAFSGDDPIALARHLLRSYSAIEERRSWYAKSLFPVHEKLLFWEALRKGATKREIRESAVNGPPRALDVGITFGDRNFFARGGEIYYLMLSAGTLRDESKRNRIATRLGHLLTQRNREIGDVADIVDQAWRELRETGDASEADSRDDAMLGWIPVSECQLYQEIVDDVDCLLQAELDPLESLALFAHLVCFHITLYIYHRASVGRSYNACMQGMCLETYQPSLLLDFLDKRNGGVVRQFSAALYKEQEQQQFKVAREYVAECTRAWADQFQGNQDFANLLAQEAEAHFSIKNLERGTKQQYHQRRDQLQSQIMRGEITEANFLESYTQELTELLFNGFTKHFVGVHRKLGRSIGFIAPQKGSNQRFVLGDTLLKALVLANVTPGSVIPYDELLERLHRRYGFVIGLREARLSGLYERHSINASYFDDNRMALLEKMKSAGLLREYSDATAMVRA